MTGLLYSEKCMILFSIDFCFIDKLTSKFVDELTSTPHKKTYPLTCQLVNKKINVNVPLAQHWHLLPIAPV